MEGERKSNFAVMQDALTHLGTQLTATQKEGVTQVAMVLTEVGITRTVTATASAAFSVSASVEEKDEVS
jgi:hypothetical protein